MATLNVTDETFDEQVIESPVPVVIDFWAEWCGPCKQIGPALEELSEEYGEKIKIAKINVDENPDSPSKLGVRGIPALFIFKNGEMVSSKIGAAPKTDLKNWISAESVQYLGRINNGNGTTSAQFRSTSPVSTSASQFIQFIISEKRL